MKKRTILWGIFLLVSLLIMLVNKCAKAESWVIPATSPQPTLEPFPSFSMPTETPAPAVSPVPGSGTEEPAATGAPVERSIPAELQPTTIYTRQYRTQYYNNTYGVGYNYYLFNGGGSASLQGTTLRNYARRIYGGSVVYDENWDDAQHDFLNYFPISDGTLTAGQIGSVNIKEGSFVWAFADYPESAITLNDFSVSYTVRFDNMRLFFSYPSAFEAAFQNQGFTLSTLLTAPVALQISVYDTYGDLVPSSYWEVTQSSSINAFLTLGDFYNGKGFTFSIEFLGLPDITNIAEVDFMIVATPLEENLLFDKIWVGFQNTGLVATNINDYGTWSVAHDAIFIQRVVRDNQILNLPNLLSGIGNFFSGLFDNFFIPDSADIQSILLQGVDDFGGDETSSFVRGLRNTIFSLFTVEPPHAVIHIPDFFIYMSANAHQGEQLFTATDIDITKLFSDEPKLTTVQNYAKLASSYAITCAFVSSLFYIVAAVFDLHIWKGVDDE